MRMSNQKTKPLRPLYFLRKMAYQISNRISTPMVAKIPHANSGMNNYSASFVKCSFSTIRTNDAMLRSVSFAASLIWFFSCSDRGTTTWFFLCSSRLKIGFLPAIISPPFYSANRHSFLCLNNRRRQ